jgi:dethiobiotin synthetase
MTRGIFVTGTDTSVGKTWVSAGIMAALQLQGKRVLGMKPVAAGCDETADGLRNEDALLLQQQGSLPMDYALINPYAFAPPVAPHLAAAQASVHIDLERIERYYQTLAEAADAVVVEGAGGWLVPLNERDSMADLAARLELEVVLVVGLRLGCINHALLTAESIRAHGGKLTGWVANTLDLHMSKLPQNVLSIQQRIGAPLLGLIPYMGALSVDAIAGRITLNPG